MDVPAPLLVVGGVFVAAAILWIVVQIARPRPRAAPQGPVFAPANELERLLVAASDSPDAQQAFERALRSATLLAMESQEAPGSPMDLTLTFPAGFGGGSRSLQLNDQGKQQFGPWVVCFTSPDMVDGLSRTVMGPLVTEMGGVREFSAREIFASALARHTDLIVNPFCGVTVRYTQEDLRELLEG